MPNLFIASTVAGSGDIQTSPDGINWTDRTPGVTAGLRGLAWSPTLGLMVGAGDSGVVYTSPTGTTWTLRTTVSGTPQMFAAAWSPSLGLFVIGGATGAMMTSPDGITWTSRSSGFGSDTIRSLAWSPALGMFAAVGTNGHIATSTNGTAWTDRSTLATSLFGVVWADTLGMFVAVGTGGRVVTSTNGTAWTEQGSGTSANLTAVGWSSALGRLIAVGIGPTLIHSTNGTSWTDASSGFAATFGSSSARSVDWSPSLGLFLVGGDSGAMATSASGTGSWTFRSSPFSLASAQVTALMWAASGGVPRDGTVTAAPALSASQFVAFARTASATAAPALSATRVAAMVRTGNVAAAPVLSAVAQVDDGTRAGTITAAPVLTATVVARLTRTGTVTAAAAVSATQVNQVSPARTGTITAAAAASAVGLISKQTRTGSITAAPSLSGPGIPDIAIPPGPPVVGKVDMRLRAYAPNGDSMGLLPAPSNIRCAMPLNDIPGLTMTYGVGVPRSDLLGQPLEVAVELTQDGGFTWWEPYDGRFLYLTDARDPARAADEYQAEAKGYVWRLTKAKVLAEGALNGEGRREFTATAGSILGTLWAEAQARGALQGMTLVGAGTNDAEGNPWFLSLTRAYDVGQDYLSVLMDLEAIGYLDFRVMGRELRLYRKDLGMARDLTVTPLQTTLTPLQVTEAPFRRTWEGLADHITVVGDEGTTVAVTNPGALRPWGRWEDYVAAGGVSDTGTLTAVGQRYQTLTADARMEVTHGLALGIGQTPLLDYLVGDYVWVQPSSGAKVKYRVRQATLEKDGQTVQGNVVLNDRFLEQDIRQRRIIDNIVSGASASSTGPLPTPPGPDILQPAAVVSLTGSSSTYVDAGGITWGQVSLDWPDVTTNLDGTPLTDLAYYEVQTKKGDSASTAQWQRMADSMESRASMSPYVPGDLWTFRVRAVDTVNNRGPWSPVFTVTISADTTGPAKPATPTATSRLGVGSITWSGLAFGGLPMDADFAYAAVHLSTVNGFTWGPANRFTTMSKAETVQAGPLTMGATYYGRLVPYDTTGNAGTPSDQFSFTVAQLYDTSNFPADAAPYFAAYVGEFMQLNADQVTANGAAIGFLETGIIQGGIFETTAGGEFRTAADPSVTGGVRIRNTGFKAYGNKGLSTVVETVSIDPVTGLLTAVDATLSGTVRADGQSGAFARLSGGQPGSGTGNPVLEMQAAGSASYVWMNKTTGELVIYNNATAGIELTAPKVDIFGAVTISADLTFAGSLPTIATPPNLRVGDDNKLYKNPDVSYGANGSGGTGFKLLRVPN